MKALNYRKGILILLTLVITSFAACKKDSKNTGNNDDPNSNVLIAENNNKAFGKYSGIIVGSLGYYYVELRSVGSKAVVIFDGQTFTLDGQGTIEDGKAITNYVLQKDGIKITISVDADGKNPKVKIEIPGHATATTVTKESTLLETRQYTGKITDLGQGDFPAALTLGNNTLSGYMRGEVSGVVTMYPFSGTPFSGNTYLVKFRDLPDDVFSIAESGGKITGGNNTTGGDNLVFNLTKVN